MRIFLDEEQVQPEVSKFIVLLNDGYRDFGFNRSAGETVTFRPEKTVGSDETWDKAEAGCIGPEPERAGL